MPEASMPVIDSVAVRAHERRLLRNRGSWDVGWLARQIATRLDERLSIIKAQPNRILDASGRLGHGMAVLSKRYPQAHILSVERHHPALQHHAGQARTGWLARWLKPPSTEPRHGLLGPGEPWPRDVQLAWSNLDLHSRGDPMAELVAWHAAVEPGGFVMFSALGPASFQELQRWHRELGFGPATIPFVDMHDHGDMLLQAGFADPVMDQEQLTLTWADPVALERDLRALGGNVHPSRFAGLRTPRWRERLRDAWRAHAGPQGRLSMTVEVAYGHAFRVEREARGSREGRITVEALRATARKG